MDSCITSRKYSNSKRLKNILCFHVFLICLGNAPVVENGDERATERKQTIVAITMPLWEVSCISNLKIGEVTMLVDLETKGSV